MAEREGFEPSIGFTLYALSRGAPSATRPPLQNSFTGFGARVTRRYAPRPAGRRRSSGAPCAGFASSGSATRPPLQNSFAGFGARVTRRCAPRPSGRRRSSGAPCAGFASSGSATRPPLQNFFTGFGARVTRRYTPRPAGRRRSSGAPCAGFASSGVSHPAASSEGAHDTTMTAKSKALARLGNRA